MRKSPLTTHVLDTAKGRPAPGIRVVLERRGAAGSSAWSTLATGVTDEDGRVNNLLVADDRLYPGIHRLTFFVSEYQESFYPEISVVFEVKSSEDHFHLPLLLSPFGYSTYRGS